MRRSRIYVDMDLSMGSRHELAADKTHYLKNVLRLKSGHPVILFNGQSEQDFIGEVELEGKKAFVNLSSSLPKNHESPLNIILLQAMGKPEHMDLLIQKATELGVDQFIFFNSEHTQTPLKSNRLDKKMAHWQGIIISACEQCGRNIIPKLRFIPDYKTCLKQLEPANRLLLDFNGSTLKDLIQKFETTADFQLLTGPEGGLSSDETQFASELNFRKCRIGPRVLRMETASISITTLVQHYFGDMK